MTKLILLACVSVTFAIIGCSGKDVVKNENNEADIIIEVTDDSVETVSKPDILENGKETVLFTVDWIEGPTNIVIHEDAYRHVVGYADDDQVFKPNKSAVTNPVPVSDKQTTLFNQNSMEHALDVAQTRASKMQVKSKNKVQTKEYYKAWVKECLHEPMSEEEEMLVSTTDMPAFLNNSCIPNK
jgi:hypothetical protein